MPATIALLLILAWSTSAAAAPVLRSAEVQIAITSPTSCEVVLSLVVDGAAQVEHRIAAAEGSRIELLDVRGAQQAADVRAIGRTQALVLRPDGASYGFRYRVVQPDAQTERCPIWLPTVPTDGRARSIRFAATVPPGSTAGWSMPSFTWTGTHGTATLGHLPAVVRIAYAAEGEPRRWSIAELIDALGDGDLRRRGRRLGLAGPAIAHGIRGELLRRSSSRRRSWLALYFVWAVRAAARTERRRPR